MQASLKEVAVEADRKINKFLNEVIKKRKE
jgi:hypothetical protein